MSLESIDVTGDVPSKRATDWPCEEVIRRSTPEEIKKNQRGRYVARILRGEGIVSSLRKERAPVPSRNERKRMSDHFSRFLENFLHGCSPCRDYFKVSSSLA